MIKDESKTSKATYELLNYIEFNKKEQKDLLLVIDLIREIKIELRRENVGANKTSIKN